MSDPYQQFTLSYGKSVMIIFGRGKSRSLSHSSADHATNEKAKQEEVLEFVRSNAQRRRIHQSLDKPWRAGEILSLFALFLFVVYLIFKNVCLICAFYFR